MVPWTTKHTRRVLAGICGLCVLVLAVPGNAQTGRGGLPLSVEGEWVVTSEPPDLLSPDVGQRVTIRRKSPGEYEVSWPHKGRTFLYRGSATEIRLVEIQTYDLLRKYFQGMGIPDLALREAVGARVTYSYIPSPDGRTMRFVQDRLNLRYYTQSGHLVAADIVPPSGPPTILTRVLEPPAETARGAEPSPDMRAGRAAVAQVEARGEFYVLTKEGRKVTGEAARTIALEEGAKVVTGTDGHVRMTLPDHTMFTVGPNSDLVIDKFVYDPDGSPKTIAAQLAKGVLRWVTGTVARKEPADLKVRLPVGDLGIRGTDFEATVEPEGSGQVVLYFGRLEITEKQSGFTFLLEAGQMVTFTADGAFSRPRAAKEGSRQ